MAARSGGKPFDVERGGRNVDSGVERASVGVFGSIEYVKNRMDVFEAGLTRIGFVALDPVDDFRGGKTRVSMRPWPFSTVVLRTSSSAGAVSK